jgi:hypothetical protein
MTMMHRAHSVPAKGEGPAPSGLRELLARAYGKD